MISETYHLPTLLDYCLEAGAAILKIYQKEDFSKITDFKADNSPLTLADQESHRIIAAQLKQDYPSVPLISEEGKDIDYDTRKDWNRFWLLDPLDGTKEFIKRNGQFTINIALIEEGHPILGVIYVPVEDTFYYGTRDEGAFIKKGKHAAEKITVNHKKSDLIAVRSRSHASQEEEELLSRYQVTDSISVGSSLKFCMVASGKADIYYRHGPTMEWDTAAGQAIVEAAGGKVLKDQGPEPFTYNKKSLLNGSFLCLGFEP